MGSFRVGRSLAAVLFFPGVAGLVLGEPRAGEPARALQEGDRRRPVQTLPAPEKEVLAEIRGRLVLEDGTPLEGALCEVHGWGAGQERKLKYGEPENWTEPCARTDAEGRYSIRFDPPRAFQFTLEAKSKGYPGVAWRWGEIEPGSLVDVGEVVFHEGGTIEGRIVDRSGQALLGQSWTLHADSTDVNGGPGRDETRVRVPVDSSTGRYRAENVMPGRVELSAYSRAANWIQGPRVTLAGGEELTIDLVYEGPDNARRITVTTSCRPFFVMNAPDPEHVKLVGPGGVMRASERIAGSSQSFSFDDVAPGVYTLEIDDPRYLPWNAESVRPGSEVRAHLQGSSALVLKVVDAEGQEVADASVRIEFRNVTFSPAEFEVEPLHGLLQGVFPGDHTIRVEADGLLGAVEVDGLRAGEERAVTVVVGSAMTLAGRVVHADGAPAAGVDVLLLRPAETEDSGASPIQVRNMRVEDEGRYRKELDSTVTDGKGRFRFALTGAGRYAVHASANASEVCSEVFGVSKQGSQELELVLPRGGRVRGRLRGPSGETVAGFRVAVEPEMPPDLAAFSRMQRMLRFADARSVVGVGEGGDFDVGPVPAGPVTVFLLLPEREVRRGSTIHGDSNRNRIELDRITIEESSVVERDYAVNALPGTVALRLLVDGEAAAGVEVELTSGEGSLPGNTDPHGWFGPTPAFAGTWRVRANDPESGWHYDHPVPILIAAAEENRTDVHIRVRQGTLQFLDAETGLPLAHRTIALIGWADAKIRSYAVWTRRETDDEGRATWTLAAGEYRFRLDAPDQYHRLIPSEEWRTANALWTVAGPAPKEVRL